MKEKVLITGFNGSLAKYVSKTLAPSKYSLNYLTSDKKSCSHNIFYWDIKANYIDPNAFIDIQHIIHVAGFSISNKWNFKNKQIMFDSRVKGSELLYINIKRMNVKIKTFISASAMGYYGFNQKGLKKEHNPPSQDWMSKLCIHWEKMADNFNLIGARVCKLRFALILDKNAKIIQKTNLWFKFKLALILGSGQQQLPWLHIKDAARFVNFILEDTSLKGVFNVASPQQISYYEFIKQIQLIKYPKSRLLYIPETIIKIAMAQKSVLVFNNINLCVAKMKKTGFKWEYETIDKFIKTELL